MQGSKEEDQVATCHQGQTHATRNEHYHKLWSEIKKRRLLDSFDLFWRIKILDGSIYLIRWEICHRSAKGAQMRYYPISVKAALCSVLSAWCTHLCTRLGNYQLCTLSFTVVTNFFLDSHPWQTNPHSIRTLLEDNQWWHSRRLINEGSREKTDHFQKSHLTSPTT